MKARSPLAQAIYEEALAGPSPLQRRRSWRMDDCATEAEAERWLAAHPDDPGPSLEASARTQWEDAGADNYCPDDELIHPGGARWERNVLGEAWHG